MPAITLRAHTQRGEWDGTSSADNKDFDGVKDLLRGYNQLASDEFVIAININFHEISKNKMSDPELVCFISKIPEDYDSVRFGLHVKNQDTDHPINARIISITSNLDDLFSIFKRFDLFLTPRDTNMIGRTLNIKGNISVE